MPHTITEKTSRNLEDGRGNPEIHSHGHRVGLLVTVDIHNVVLLHQVDMYAVCT